MSNEAKVLPALLRDGAVIDYAPMSGLAAVLGRPPVYQSPDALLELRADGWITLAKYIPHGHHIFTSRVERYALDDREEGS